MRALPLFVFLLTACHQVTDNPPSPRTTVNCDLDRVVIHAKWHDTVDTMPTCGNPASTVYGCTHVMYLGDGERHAYLDLLKPKDFNDAAKIGIMGHELCHALGGKHE